VEIVEKYGNYRITCRCENCIEYSDKRCLNEIDDTNCIILEEYSENKNTYKNISKNS